MQINKKEVNIYDRILCVVLSAAVSCCFVLCSLSSPLSASAASPLDAAQVIDQFAEDVDTAHDRVTQAVREDFENGNIDATSELGRQYLLAIALQTAAVNNPSVNAAIQLAQAYETGQAEAQDWIDWYNSHQTLTINSSYVASGYYRLEAGGSLRMCNVYTSPDWSNSNFGSIFISADDYSFHLETNNPSNSQCRCYNDNYNGRLFYEFQIRAKFLRWEEGSTISLIGSGIGSSISPWLDITSGHMSSEKSVTFRGTDRDALYIPVYSSVNPRSFHDPLFACGVSSDIPSAEVDTSNVYDYYNDTILPLVKQECPDVPDNYYFFYGNEYGPAPDPTEPPLFPFTQPWQNDNFVFQQTETFISVVNPTATNDSGTTYTETTIIEVPVTETSTSYVPVYGFNVPLLPELQTDTATFPNETVDSNTARNIGNMWSFIKWVLDSSGLFPVFLAFVSLGFVLYILYMLGG